MLAATKGCEVVVFSLAGQRYALPASQVGELLRAVEVVPLPQAPPIVEGIIDLRGTLVPVLDVRQRFRLPPGAPALTDHFIVGWAGRRLVALRADQALGVERLPPEAVEDLAAAVPEAPYVAGVARLADGLVLIHDLATFLSAAEAQGLDEAVDRAAAR